MEESADEDAPVRPFDGRRVLLVVAGGIAAYKSACLVRLLRRRGADVDVILTAAGERFVGEATFAALTGRPVHRDVWERPLAHIEIGRRAHVAVVAPATADLVARMANGMADDMATATLLAAACPLVVCPAMNLRMWGHPAVRANLERLESFGALVVGPGVGELAEGESGPGRMAEPEEILAEVGRKLEAASPLRGGRVVVTAGPTREPVDPVRYLGNRSSGHMGYALAESAWRRGAEVVLIAGPTTRPPPYGPRVVRVERGEEMLEALREELPGAAALLMAAAVADFRAADPAPAKLKRSDDAGERGKGVRLEPVADLLCETRAEREGVVTLGFALETENAIENARRKLTEKKLDYIAVNEAGREDAGFDVPTNRITLIDGRGGAEEWPILPKETVADRLLDRIEEHLRGDGDGGSRGDE